MALSATAFVISLLVAASNAQYGVIDSNNVNGPPLYNSTSPKFLRFIGIGDWGRQRSLESVGATPYCTDAGFAGDNELQGAAQQRETAVLMDNVCGLFGGCQFVLNTGDNFYDCGVSAGDTSRYVTDWQSIYQEVTFTPNIYNLPWYQTFGNHDIVNDGSVDTQISYSKLSSNWVMPSRNFVKDFSFAGTSVRTIFADTTAFVTKYAGSTSPYHQQDYISHHSAHYVNFVIHHIEHALKTSTADFTIIVTHFPLWGSSDSYGLNSPDNIPNVYPGEFSGWAKMDKLVQKYKPSVYLNGHDHTMTLGKAAANQDNGYTSFVTTGAGSWGENGDSCNTTDILYSNGGNGGFVLFTTRKTQMRIDYFTLGSDYPQCSVYVYKNKNKAPYYTPNCSKGVANTCCNYSGNNVAYQCYRK